MRIGLDENTRDALQFVLLGAGILLVLRLLVAGAGLLIDAPTGDPDSIIATFRNGYLLGDPGVLVTGGMALPGRLAIAGLSALSGGLALAVVFALFARILRRDMRKSAVLGGRTGLLLVALWGLYASLLLPVRSAHISDEGITIKQRGTILDVLILPWRAEELTIPWNSITGIEHRSIASSMPRGGTQELVVVLTGESEHIIAAVTPRGPDLEAATRDAVERTTRLAGSLLAFKDK
ncbi:MAG: hypothetical protein ABI432_16020 [Flavobacteriales bacterium]